MTKNLFFALLLAWGGGSAAVADNQPEWLNPQVNQQNREARRANFFAYETEALAKSGVKQASAACLLLLLHEPNVIVISIIDATTINRCFCFMFFYIFSSPAKLRISVQSTK